MGFLPLRPAAAKANCIGKTHFFEGFGSKCASMSSSAVDQEFLVSVGKSGIALRVLEIGPNFEETSGNMPCALNVASLKLVGLPDIKDLVVAQLGDLVAIHLFNGLKGFLYEIVERLTHG